MIFGILAMKIQAKIIVVLPGENLNEILNTLTEGDTIVVKPGIYGKVYLSDKRFSDKKPLVIKTYVEGSAVIKGDTVSTGSSFEMNNCSYIIIEGLKFTGSRWGIYVKNSSHILIRKNEIFGTGQEGCHVGRSSKYVDIIENTIHNTGLFNSKWAEGIYVGSGSYGRNGFPDNCEYVWVEGNHIYETGNAEGINVKGECFHVTVRNNNIHDIHPGTSEQYNQAAITVEAFDNSIKNNYRTTEIRDVWIENNTIRNVFGGYSDWNNGIMFFGSGVYILNNTVSECTNRGVFGNSWKNAGLQDYLYGNKVFECGVAVELQQELKISQSDPGSNPNSPQKWYTGF